MAIADNRTAELAEWDDEALAKVLKALDEEGLLELTGFEEGELFDLVEAGLPEVVIEEDDIPSDVDARAQLGDLWQLGSHRLICGDSTSKEVVGRLLEGEKPKLMVTDPPYGVEYDPDWRNRQGLNDGGALGIVENDDRADWQEAWELFEGEVAYVWHAGKFAKTVAESLEACSFEIRSQIIWAKSRFAISRGHYHWQHEPCWYVTRKGKTSDWTGDRKQSTLWEIALATNEEHTAHSTQKPIECMARPIRNHGKRGESVYEPFCGSGSTLIACEQLERRCYAIELNPAYVDIILTRWEALTGGEAELLSRDELSEAA